jgi:hypothetical protein
MSLLATRNTNRTIVLLALALTIFVVLFLAAPVPSTIQKLVPSAGPQVAWAGSPDETLAPPPTKRSSSMILRPTSGTSRTTISGRLLFEMMLRAYWSITRL